ncbi:unnamed protein product [Malus baccata var. baccata]
MTGPSKLHPSFSIFFTDPPVQKSRVPSGFHRRGERVGRRKRGVRKTQRKEGSSGEKSTVPFGDLVYERVSRKRPAIRVNARRSKVNESVLKGAENTKG